MIPERKYSPAVNSASLAAGMDPAAARLCRSFDGLCLERERLVLTYSLPLSMRIP